MSKKIEAGKKERMSQHLRTVLKGELTSFLITRQIQCAIDVALLNVAQCIMLNVCKYNGKQADFNLGGAEKRKMKVWG